MSKENENIIANNLNIFTLRNDDVTDDKNKNKKLNSQNLGKKRVRNNDIKKNEDDDFFDFKNIKSNNNKQNKENNHQENNKQIVNEEENTTYFSSIYNNNNEKNNNNKIVIDKNDSGFGLNEENGTQNNNISFNCFLIVLNKLMNIQDLSNEIEDLMRDINLDKKAIESYNRLYSDNLINKITIKRLNIMVNFLSNSNIINLRRKIVEVFLFELFKNNIESFNLINFTPTKANIEEIKNLINIKLKENKEEYQKEIQRLTELTNNNYNNNYNAKIYIIEKNKKKKAQIHMVYQFLKFCKQYLNPFVHASGEKINFYLLPKSCFNTDFNEAKYLFGLEDILSKEVNSDKIKIQILTEKNMFNNADIYSSKKVIDVEEALDLLISNNKVFNSLNDNFSNEIKEKQILLNESLENFNNKFDIFSQIGIKRNSSNIKIPQLKKDLLDTNRELIQKLDSFDSTISNIFSSPEFNEKICNDIKYMKQYINKYICSRDDLVDEMEKSGNPEKANDILNLNLYRLSKILIFLSKQKEKIINAYKCLFIQNEKYYKEIMEKTQSIVNLVNEKHNIKKELLFAEWKRTGPKIKNKYCNIEILRENFKDLIKNIELDTNYCYDEKLALWLIKNNFDKYLLN